MQIDYIIVYHTFDLSVFALYTSRVVAPMAVTVISLSFLGGNKLVKPTILFAPAAALLLVIGIACGGANETPAASQSSEQQQTQTGQQAPAAAEPTASEPPTAIPTVVATATPSPTSTPTAAQETETVGGRLRIATIPPVQQLTGSWLGTTTSANTQVRPFTDPLVHTDRFDGSLVPGLATRWEANEDGTQWTFYLRDDVEFHGDWGPFTAHDVPASARFIVRDDAIATDTGLFRGLFVGKNDDGSAKDDDELFSNIVALDDHTVQFNLITPNSLMDFFAGAQQGNLFMYSKAQHEAEGIEQLQAKPAGVGPWVFEERQVDVNILYSRNPDHYRRSPFFAEMEYVLIPEETTRLAQLTTGQVQIGEISRELHLDAQGAGLTVLQSELPSIQVAFIIGGVYNPEEAGPCLTDDVENCFYQAGEPHLNPKVREAINRSINRDEINQQLFGGIGRQHTVWGYHPALPGYNPRWTEEFDDKYGFDPDLAAQLLEESGHKGYKLNLLLTELPGVPEMIPMGEAAFSYLTNIGIDVETEAIKWSDYRAKYYRPGKTHGTLAASRGTYRPADITLRFYNRSGDAGFWRTSVDPMTDVLYDKATQSVDPEVKAQALRDLGDLKFDLYSEVPIVWLPAQVVVNPAEIGEMAWPGNINASFTHTEYITPAAN